MFARHFGNRGGAVTLNQRLKAVEKTNTDAGLPDAKRGSGLTAGERLDLSA